MDGWDLQGMLLHGSALTPASQQCVLPCQLYLSLEAEVAILQGLGDFARRQCCARLLWGWAVGVSTRRVLGRLVLSLGASCSTSVCLSLQHRFREKRSSLSIASKQQPVPPVLCLCSMVSTSWPCVCLSLLFILSEDAFSVQEVLRASPAPRSPAGMGAL